MNAKFFFSRKIEVYKSLYSLSTLDISPVVFFFCSKLKFIALTSKVVDFLVLISVLFVISENR